MLCMSCHPFEYYLKKEKGIMARELSCRSQDLKTNTLQGAEMPDRSHHESSMYMLFPLNDLCSSYANPWLF